MVLPDRIELWLFTLRALKNQGFSSSLGETV
jgi:hypothetical protein